MHITPKRCCIFAHFDRDGIIDPYVLIYLDALRPFVEKIIFISTSQLDINEVTQLERSGVDVICRENYGYDFYSWKVGLDSISLDNFDEILQVNDSCYAPLFDFSRMFTKMDKIECDFWGITQSHRFKRHLQSYFICYRSSVLQSPAFIEFWRKLEALDDYLALVKKYEVGISQALLTNGFKMESYFRVSPLDYTRKLPRNLLQKIPVTCNLNPYKYLRTLLISNPTHYYHKEMLDQKVPVIKVKLVSNCHMYGVRPTNLNSIDSINNETRTLLHNHQVRMGAIEKAEAWAPLVEPDK